MLSVQRPRPMSGRVTEPAHALRIAFMRNAAWYGREAGLNERRPA